MGQFREDRCPIGALHSRLLAGARDDPDIFGMAALVTDEWARRLAAFNHAGASVGLVFRRLAVALDPLEHARSIAQRIRQTGATKGPTRLRRAGHARLQERPDPGVDPGWRQSR